tara:strand:+ start:522 stop:812 length:291 start_codon:yes stop_codon:yes gene_type:complete
MSEDSYRKRFPKGKDWKTPKKNPYGFCGLNESSYHGMETVAVSIEKYEEAQKEINRLQILWAKKSDEIRELKKQYYFDMRNKQVEIETLKNQMKEL